MQVGVDVSSFVSECLQLNRKQRDIVCNSSRFKIVQAVRQSGKTSKVCYATIINEIISNPHKTVLFMATDLKNIDRVKSELRKQIITLFKSEDIISVCNRNQICLRNYSRVIFGTFNSPDCARGLGINMLVMDEMAYAQSQAHLKDFWSSTYPVLVTSNSKILIISTRKSRSKKKDLFWKLWVDAVEEKSKFVPFTIGAKDCPHANARSAWKKHMSRAAYDREHTLRRK